LVKVRVSYISLTAEITGRRSETIELKGDGIKLSDLLNELFRRYPKLRDLKSKLNILILINGNSVKNHNMKLIDGDEVAILPPTSGG